MSVQEFVAELRATKFERHRKDGTLVKTYRLFRKTVLNIVGVVKLVLGRKVWKTWEIDLGKPQRSRQPYFTEEQFKRIIQAAPRRYRVLFLVLAGTGMRIGEAVGLHLDDLDLEHGVICIRRSVWRGHELTPKTENAVRDVDIDAALVNVLREYIGESKRTLLFESSAVDRTLKFADDRSLLAHEGGIGIPSRGGRKSWGHFACWTHRTHIGPRPKRLRVAVSNAA